MPYKSEEVGYYADVTSCLVSQITNVQYLKNLHDLAWFWYQKNQGEDEEENIA